MPRDVRYSVVIPVFNEEAVIRETYRRLTQVMKALGEPYELLFVNDGSGDRTAEIIASLAAVDARVILLDLSRNFGHQIAITAGIDHARGDAVVIIDADLQDPPELIPSMIEKWQEGYDVVYARRIQRKGETRFKRWTASLFYRTLQLLTDVTIPLDTGDFRLIDRQVCAAMRGMREKNRFVRGLVSWVGFRQTAIEYVRDERWAGESKYPLKKMMRLAMDAVTSFSLKPLKLATWLGGLTFAGGLLSLLVLWGQKLFVHAAVNAWAIPFACLVLLDGVLMLLLGILGEYIGRMFDETRNRPLYLLRNRNKEESLQREEVRWSVPK